MYKTRTNQPVRTDSLPDLLDNAIIINTGDFMVNETTAKYVYNGTGNETICVVYDGDPKDSTGQPVDKHTITSWEIDGNYNNVFMYSVPGLNQIGQDVNVYFTSKSWRSLNNNTYIYTDSIYYDTIKFFVGTEYDINIDGMATDINTGYVSFFLSDMISSQETTTMFGIINRGTLFGNRYLQPIILRKVEI